MLMPELDRVDIDVENTVKSNDSYRSHITCDSTLAFDVGLRKAINGILEFNQTVYILRNQGDTLT